MSATAQNDRVNNITLEDINAKVVDTFNKSSEIMKRVVSKPKQWNGRSFQFPIIVNNSSLGQSFKGTETFDTAIDANWPTGVVYPTGYAQPVGVSIVERSINATPAGVVDLYRASYEYAQNSMITNVGTMFYQFGTGNDFDGLGLIVDDGTSTTSYAGLTRSTYPTINGFLVAASGGVLDLATMSAADDGASIAGDIGQTPNVILTTQTVWSLYDSILEPGVRSTFSGLGGAFIDGSTAVGTQPSTNDALSLNAGALNTRFRGKPVVRDNKAPAGKLFFLNESWFQFRSLSLKGLSTVAIDESATTGAYDNLKVSAVQFRDFMQPVNQLSEVGIFVMYGNLICTNPNRNALITGVTTT